MCKMLASCRAARDWNLSPRSSVSRGATSSQFPAQQKAVKTELNNNQQPTISGYAISEQLHLALKTAHGEDLSYAKVADQIGAAHSTHHRWCRDVGVEHLRIITSLMELLIAEERTNFWNVVCRERPSLRDSRLAHDSNGIVQLHALLRKPNGLTVITGPGSAASFVLTALGLEFRRQDRSHRSPVGLSVHAPHSMMPVPGVNYLPPLASRHEHCRAMRDCWTRLVQTPAPLVLLDAVPVVGSEVLALAREKHVVLTQARLPDWLPSGGSSVASLHQVSVTTSLHPAAPINVRVNTIA